ncbi:MAG: class I SAM-dependent rRNA methyltransferase [Candidatus Helarchaeota archaeon]
MSFKIKGKIIINKEVEKIIKSKSSEIIYKKNIRKIEEGLNPGDMVEIYNEYNELLGIGFYESMENIGIRIMTFGEDTFDEDYIIKKFKNAKKLRNKLGFTDNFRWINSTGDSFSGLIVDKFNDLVVIESFSVGIDKILNRIADIIMNIDRDIKAVYVRNDVRNRKRFNLKIWKGFIGNPIEIKTQTIIKESSAKFYVDIEKGNKTGFYLDQKPNRIESEKYAKNCKNVLDCFSYTGGFGIHAILQGASVTFVEHDPNSVQMLKKNLALNDISSGFKIYETDFWQYIKKDDNKYDMIILDPPSFISNRNEIKIGEQKYYKMNYLALPRLNDGGILVTSSCSYFLDINRLQSIILKAADNLNIKLIRLGRVRGASVCHSIAPKVPGIEYLKCYFFIKEG